MNNQPKISILIPLYNSEPYITECLQSVVRQTYKGDIECIIVDDCGTDDSVRNVEKFIKDYTGTIDFKLLHHTYNRGLAAARNTAVAMAMGEFIMHVDPDDWLEVNAVELLVNRHLETCADIVSGNAVAHYRDRTENLIEPDYANANEMVHQTIKLTLDHVIWRRIIRKSLYTEHNIRAVEGVNRAEGHHTLPRLVFYAKSIAKVDKVVYHYNCMNENSYMRVNQSQQVNMKKYCDDRDSINILLDFFSDKDDDCVRELNEIKIVNALGFLWGVLKAGDRHAFDQIRKDLLSAADYALVSEWSPNHLRHIAHHYYWYWLKVRMLILVKKLTGRRNYKL